MTCLLNGSGPFNFLLDTGVSTSIITSPEIADQLHLRHGENFRVVGAGGADTGLLAYKTDSVNFSLGRALAPHLSLLVLSHRGKLEAGFENQLFVHQLLCLRLAGHQDKPDGRPS